MPRNCGPLHGFSTRSRRLQHRRRRPPSACAPEATLLMDDQLTIGGIARRTGLSADTIRLIKSL